MNETLSFCIHGVPVKMVCATCAHEHRLNNVESLIRHAQDGIEKCFERIEGIDESFKTQCFMNQCQSETNRILIDKLEKIEKLNKECMDANPLTEIEKRFKKIEGNFNHVPSFEYIDEKIKGFTTFLNNIAATVHRIERDETLVNMIMEQKERIDELENIINSLEVKHIYTRLNELFYEFQIGRAHV